MPPQPRLSDRRSGVLLHITSLPGPYGSGDLGGETARFLDFLAAAGQAWWQMLPIGPPGLSYCPYMAASAFAVDPHLIDLDALREEGLLSESDLRPDFPGSAPHADFARSGRFRDLRLEQAYTAYSADAGRVERRELEEFQVAEAGWLTDAALFQALKQENGGATWTDWEPGIRGREPIALARARERLAEPVRRYAWGQYVLARQWNKLRAESRARGIGLIGDLPIFVAHESADVWAHPEIFWLDENGRPQFVAGVPPDYFSATGQRWGHPLYRWDVLRDRNYGWWIARLRRTLSLFDAVRLDHFIGFQRYWEIPASSPTAIGGRWQPGPAERFFDTVLSELGDVPLIAEDLGSVGDDVIVLRRRYGLPGMRVLQFAFSGDPQNDHLPHRYEQCLVVYTGTHDNDTTAGWFGELTARAAESDPARSREAEEARRDRDFVLRYLGLPEGSGDLHWRLIRTALASVANLAVIPAQDLLGLGSEARMNKPSESDGNWEWRLAPGALDEGIAARLCGLTSIYGRLPRSE